MNRAHLVPLALAFLIGIVSDLREFALPVLGASCLLGFVARLVPGRNRAYAGGALALGIVDAEVFAHAPPQLADVHFGRLSAIVLDARATDTGRTHATVRLTDGSRASLDIGGPPPPIGTRLLLRGKRGVFDDARNPGEPSQREIERERGITWQIVRGRVLARAPPEIGDASLWLARARAWASSRLHATLGEPEATILAGAMWGERGMLPPDLREEFQDTGTVHVLVTAGLHLGVVAALTVALLQYLQFGRIGAALVAIAVVWAYAAFSGAHLPSLRAATMLTFALVARAAGREAFSWNALALAAIVVAAVRPTSVISVSFALSFSCVAAIFAFAPSIARGLDDAGVPRTLSEAIGVTLATQLGTWPLTASAFLVLAPYAPLANIAVVPVVGVALLVGFAALAVAPITPLAALLANIETALLDWIVGTVRFVATLPGAHVVATPPPPWTIAAYDVALFVAALAVARGRTRGAVATIACASALCLWPPRCASRELVITAIDVGQADAILIRTPRGHAFLVDAGGRLERGAQRSGDSSAQDVGRRIVVPLLLHYGIHHLDGVLLSHPHGDHAGGVAPVLRTLGADGLADSGQPYAGHAYNSALLTARERHVPLLEPRGGDVWRTHDGVTLRFYGPTLPYIAGGRNDVNDNSLVFRLEFGGFRMLFTGDAGMATERRLVRRGFDLRANVLKVGHHGSAYGTTPIFLRFVDPQDAIVSVGRQNAFGHPAPSTLATLRARGIRVHRTDAGGSITVSTDGRYVRVDDFLKADNAVR